MSSFWADFFFIFLSFVAILSALYVVSTENLVRAAFALFFTLFSVAGLYALLSADFIAVVQVMIYVGGVLVLIIFGILLTKTVYDMKLYDKKLSKFWAGIVVVVFGFVMSEMIFGTGWLTKQNTSIQPITEKLGNIFLSRYLLPFELASVLLLVAIVGALFIARREVKGK